MRKCRIEDCEKPSSRTYLLCSMHQARWNRHKDVNATKWPATPEIGFWSKVEKTDTCWIWNGAIKGTTGYGCFVYKKKNFSVHRLSYEWLVGPIPANLQIDHLCRNRVCVNPEHLEPVTHRVNTLRGVGPTAVNAAKTLCKRGHPLSGDNLYIAKTGYRKCRECSRLHARGEL